LPTPCSATKRNYTVWDPEHFRREFDLVVGELEKINARNVILCTVPHVTIIPVARGVGTKSAPGSRYFDYYTRPWISDADFDPMHDPNITAAEARAVDYAIDLYNEHIEAAVKSARDAGRNWYLFDIAGVLDRLAWRRYINDPSAAPPWWSKYPLPPALAALTPEPDTQFLTANGQGGRRKGGLISLDGIHPTTVAYGIVAQELIDIMQLAGVGFASPNGAPASAARQGGFRPVDRKGHAGQRATAERQLHVGHRRLARSDGGRVLPVLHPPLEHHHQGHHKTSDKTELSPGPATPRPAPHPARRRSPGCSSRGAGPRGPRSARC
jgi:hypothetical protein